jgi:O-antigen ligase
MRSRLEDTAETGDTAGRTEIWHNLFQIIKAKPVLGIGRTGFIYETTAIYGGEKSAHNVLIEILCYTGIIGLLTYLYFLYQIGMSSYNTYQKTSLLMPLIFMIPIAGMIMSIQILTHKIGWIIYAYIVSSLAVKRDTILNN